MLLSLHEEPGTTASVSENLRLPARVVSACVIRLMRFGFIELRTDSGRNLEASASGREFINSDRALPEHRTSREFGFNLVYEKLGRSVLARWDVDVVFPDQIRERADNCILEFSTLESPETEVSMSARVADHIEKSLRPGEWLRGVQTVGSVLRKCYVEVDIAAVNEGIFPDGSSQALESALKEFERTSVLPKLSIEDDTKKTAPDVFENAVSLEDLLLSSEEHLTAFERVVGRAKQDVFVLSTWVAEATNENGLVARERIYAALVAACRRGVRCHLFFGTSKEEEGSQSARRLLKLRDILDARSKTRGLLLAHLEPVGSHSKFLIADDGQNGAVAIVGSCNWLSSGFRPIELSIVLNDPVIVAAQAEILASIASSAATTVRSTQALHALARMLRRERRTLRLTRSPIEAPNARISFLHAGQHDHMLREAAHSAQRRFVCSSNKVGANLVIGVLNAAEHAAKQIDDVRLYYSVTSGPMRDDHMVDQAERLRGRVDIVRLKSPVIHAKFVLWDEDDLVVSSLNWASQNGSADSEFDEFGLHINSKGIASEVLAKFDQLYSAARSQKK